MVANCIAASQQMKGNNWQQRAVREPSLEKKKDHRQDSKDTKNSKVGATRWVAPIT
jgi:predicted HAD superfamily Cof-like phosphohydrolase